MAIGEQATPQTRGWTSNEPATPPDAGPLDRDRHDRQSDAFIDLAGR